MSKHKKRRVISPKLAIRQIGEKFGLQGKVEEVTPEQVYDGDVIYLKDAGDGARVICTCGSQSDVYDSFARMATWATQHRDETGHQLRMGG